MSVGCFGWMGHYFEWVGGEWGCMGYYFGWVGVGEALFWVDGGGDEWG